MNAANHPPPPPEKPDPNECCGSGCVPCIYDYYFERLDAWESQHGISLREYESARAQAVSKEI